MKREFTVSSGLELEKVTELIKRDIEKRVDDACIEIVNQAAFSCRKYAQWLTPRRLPSRGGGSYGVSHGMGVSPGFREYMWNRSRDAYNNHQWAAAVEFGTEPHKITTDLPTGMKIEWVLPTRGGGKGQPPVPPYGTKYVRINPRARKKPHRATYAVDHPGGRSFEIYGATYKRQCGLMPRLIKRGLREKMKA